jgi:hypothetical protein
MIKTIYFQMYHMELALIIYRGDNDYHARFIRLKLSSENILKVMKTKIAIIIQQTSGIGRSWIQRK